MALGLDPEKDLEVTVTGDTVSIRGERREEEQDKRHHEIHYGEFIRSLRLPKGSHTDDVDDDLHRRCPRGADPGRDRWCKHAHGADHA